MGKFQLVQVGKRKIKLSNLDKVLFPESGIIKAELVAYYLKLAPTLLRHIKRRPLSLIRYPDGINAHLFFQKDKPDWAPEWIESVPLGKEDKKHYILATEEASLVWLANLACIELHVRQDRYPANDHPDYFVFDLDPSEGQPFSEIVGIACALKNFIEPFGYRPFVKTSGGKGIHMLVPIEPVYDYDVMFETVKSLAEKFVSRHKSDCTLKISKVARKGKLLVDIFRNHASQTIVAPYSVRGREPGPVSMPLGWDELLTIEDPVEFHLRNAEEKVKKDGDAWEGFSSFAVHLHDQKTTTSGQQAELPPSKYFKTPEQLEAYRAKRDFQKTPEPAPVPVTSDGHAFVVHRHHASRLHYDLRLEKDGTLLSWAVPKGLPHKPGVKRLAVETEPHPVEYLHFDGEIPKGEYGGGKMWIFARGKYSITKEKKDGFYFHLSSRQLDGEYRMYQIKEKEWLLERVDRDQIDVLTDRFEPMLAERKKELPDRPDDFFYEVKWDGIRALIAIDEGEIIIRSRNQNDITAKFPELCDINGSFHLSNAILDTEIVCLDSRGLPQFKKVISRLHNNSSAKIERMSKTQPVVCYVFDCLYLDGRSLVNEPVEKRREWMRDMIKKGGPYRISESEEDGEALFEAAKKVGLEGIIAKRRGSKYTMGRRNQDWMKIKFRQSEDVYIIGYTEGKGDREPYFGALQIAEKNGKTWQYRGRVGTGFDTARMKQIYDLLIAMNKTPNPVSEIIPDQDQSIWVEPVLSCEVQFASITDNGTYREPVFVKLND